MSVATPAVLRAPRDLELWRDSIRGRGNDPLVRVCTGPGCAAKGAGRLYAAFREAMGNAVATSGTTDHPAAVKGVGCHGMCERGPLVLVDPSGDGRGSPGEILYQRVQESDVEEILRETVRGGRIVSRLLYQGPGAEGSCSCARDIPFYRGQQRIVLDRNGEVDPESIEDYIAGGGYGALVKALSTMQPEEVIREVETSGLRGRGGGGYPTGRKWRSCREAHGDPKYVICNGDEGDPGAFMDRAVMEGNPHAVLEGMIIGAYAIGSSHGYIYVRNEYPLSVERLGLAIGDLRRCGLLGKDILGSGFSFDIRINRGGGAFVCGESTALMASLEGRAGEPRAKYVHTTESGLNGSPTNLNNVETWANVPHIIAKGGAWFASIGTAGSKGTKVFSLVGKIENTGLVEVPMGTPLRRIIEEIGGGAKGGKTFKAVQTGGPSGGCIPAEHLDTAVDFDELTRLGSMMGSGGMIVMDEDTCMVAVARYFFGFLKGESCGKCTPCREGTAQALAILDRIVHGEGKSGDLETLESLAEILSEASLCGLGKTAANPLLSTLRYFRSEYEEHITARHCPARECRGMFRYEISAEACTGCMVCRKACPVSAIAGERKKPHVIDQMFCTHCNVCFEKCRFGAILKV